MDISTEQDLIEIIEQTRFSLREGIVNRFGKVDEFTFEHVFDFHCAAMRMMIEREHRLRVELAEAKGIVGEH